MTINGDKIKKLITEEHLIENYNFDNVSSVSYDLTASNQLLEFNPLNKTIELDDKETIEKMYKLIDFTNGYTLKPNKSILVVLNEKINMPNNMSAHIRPRTSLTRLGLVTNIQHINAGYSGVLNYLL